MKKLLGLLLIVGIAGAPLAVRAADSADMQKLDQRLANAQSVLDAIMSSGDKSIPESIAAQAACVAVVPGLVKGAFILGAEYGQGVATCRTAHGWSGPVFLRMAGGSWGFQIGGKGTDLVLVAVNKKGMQDLLQSKFKIGAGVSAAAGPVGRSADAATDLSMRSELLTWSRSRGVFAGIDLNGVTVSQNSDDTSDLYGGQFHKFDSILNGQVPPPQAARPFLHTVAKYFGESREAHEQHERNEH